MDITKRVQKIYQLEAELEPYLIVDFWGNKDDEPASVTLYLGDECVLYKKSINLDNKEEFEELRRLIWKYVREYHNPPDLADKDGCLHSMELLQKNKVIQGWQNKRKSMCNKEGKYSCYMSGQPVNNRPKKQPTCTPEQINKLNKYYTNKHCLRISNIITKAYLKYITGRETMEDKVKHWSYRDPPIYPKPNMDKKLCKQLRLQDCTDNFAKFTPQWQRCASETEWLCNKYYNTEENPLLQTDKLVEETRKEVYKYLNDNNLKVDRSTFDKIITAGLFDDLGNRAGNKATDMMSINDSVNQYMADKDYYLDLVEGFGSPESRPSIRYLIYFVIIAVVIFLCVKLSAC
jgi:hypothetical protein